MSAALPRWLLHTSGISLLAAFTTLSTAAVTDYEKHADGLAVYMGVMPAQVIRGNTDTGHLATMHGGLPSGSGSHHVVISIFDERTGRQVGDAAVEAIVIPLGLTETRRRMESMKIADTTTYGNYFPMAGTGPFVVRVTIRRPGQDRPTQVQFNYVHPK